MRNIMKLFGGNKANLPSLSKRELVYCDDTGEMYIGTDSGNKELLPKVINVKNFGVKCDGSTNDTTAIQNAITVATTIGAKEVIFPKNTSFVVNSEILLDGNLVYNFNNSTLITTMENANNPTNFLTINGDNIKIQNLKLLLDSAKVDTSTKARAIGFASDKSTFDNIVIEDCDIRYAYYCLYAYNKTITKLKLINNTFIGLRQDILLNKVLGNDYTIKENRFLGDKTWTTPVQSLGEINIYFGIDHPVNVSNEQMTNAVYENNCGKNIKIYDNYFYRSNHRPIYIINAEGVRVKNNHIEGAVGDKATVGVSDDCIILEYCRNFVIDGNYTGASGENGIDILASKRGTVKGNTCLYTDDVGIVFSGGDIDVLGYASTLSSDYRIPSDVKVVGNTFNSKETCLKFMLGRNIVFTDNNLSVYGSGAKKHWAIIGATFATFIESSLTNRIANIKCKSNTIDTATASWVNDSLTMNRVEYGTIELGKELAVQSSNISVTANNTLAWVHNGGLFNNVEIFFYLDPAQLSTYGTDSTKVGSYMKINLRYTDNPDTGAKTRGVWAVWQDVNQVIYRVADYLVDVPNRTSGTGINLGLITSGNIKIVTY